MNPHELSIRPPFPDAGFHQQNTVAQAAHEDRRSVSTTTAIALLTALALTACGSESPQRPAQTSALPAGEVVQVLPGDVMQVEEVEANGQEITAYPAGFAETIHIQPVASRTKATGGKTPGLPSSGVKPTGRSTPSTTAGPAKTTPTATKPKAKKRRSKTTTPPGFVFLTPEADEVDLELCRAKPEIDQAVGAIGANCTVIEMSLYSYQQLIADTVRVGDIVTADEAFVAQQD